MRDRPVTETSTWQQTTLTRDRYLCPSGGIGTRNPSKRAGADQRLRPRGYRHRNEPVFHEYFLHITYLSISAFWRWMLYIVSNFLASSQKSFVMSVCVCPSVLSHGTPRLPMDRFSWNLIFEYLSKSVKQIQISLKSGKNTGYLTWMPMYMCDIWRISA
jgi:hypothetical protein